MGNLTLRLNNKNRAVTQYTNFNFNSVCEFNGKLLATSPDGLYELEEQNTDDGTEIDAYMTFPNTDFGMANNKRIRTVYVGYTTNGELALTVEDDEENETTYTLPINKNQKQNVSKLNAGRNYNKGCYYQLKISNTDGCYFDIDFIKLIVIVLTKKPGGF